MVKGILGGLLTIIVFVSSFDPLVALPATKLQ
jgi:hypothetical protein